VRLGPWDLQVVSGGTFRLDGGGMFGTVPKVLWDPLCPADAENRILMACNCLLLRGQVAGRQRTVLVDTGNGDKQDDRFMARFQMEGRGVLARNLARAGVTPADVDLVVLTHLHFDHAGGATGLDPAGLPVPAFPNARYVVQQRDLDNARAPPHGNGPRTWPGTGSPWPRPGGWTWSRAPANCCPDCGCAPRPATPPASRRWR